MLLIAKISPGAYKFQRPCLRGFKALQIQAPQNRNAKNPSLNRPSKYKPPPPPTPEGLHLEFALEYKVKQSKNGKFPSNCKLAQSILKRKFPSIHKPLQNKTMFYLKINSYFVKLCNKTCGTSRFRIEGFNSNSVKCSICVAWQYRPLSQQNPQLFKYFPLFIKICFMFSPKLY